MKRILLLLTICLMAVSCGPAPDGPDDPDGGKEQVPDNPDPGQPENPDPGQPEDEYTPVSIKSAVTAVQPATGLVLWSDQARSRNSSYGESISLEYAYCLPCKVVKGKSDGKIQYDWSSFNSWLARCGRQIRLHRSPGLH